VNEKKDVGLQFITSSHPFLYLIGPMMKVLFDDFFSLLVSAQEAECFREGRT